MPVSFEPCGCPRSNFPPRYNVAPTDQIPVIRIDLRDGEREVVMARWGLIPFWMKEKPRVPHINARAETVHKLPLFREAFAKRRCLIPATGFYEWQQRDDGKQPYRFRRKDLEPFAFAGVWEFARLGGEAILSTAIIVGDPNPERARFQGDLELGEKLIGASASIGAPSINHRFGTKRGSPRF